MFSFLAMLYIIGLGLNLKGISIAGMEAVKRAKKVYLESYTVDFPYPLSELTEFFDKKIEMADREKVEGLSIVDEAKKKDIALLVYGSPLTATTHITLIQEAKNSRVKCKVIYAGSVLDAVARSGLQLYKFGKIASMPAWKPSFTPDSFMEIVKENQGINAHSLILVDIGLNFEDALEQLKKAAENHKVKIKDLLVCQSLGTRQQKFIYAKLEEFRKMFVRKPYCFVIPTKLHFVEKEVLESFDY